MGLIRHAVLSLVLAVTLFGPVSAAESQCFGTVNKGRIEGSVRLPSSGANFSAYSSPWVRHDEHEHVDFAVSCQHDSG